MLKRNDVATRGGLSDAARLDLLDRFAGVGLWSVELGATNWSASDHPFAYSSEFRRLIGYDNEADFPNIISSWKEALHPEDAENTLTSFLAAIEDRSSGDKKYDTHYRLRMKDGSYRWFRAVWGFSRDKTGTAQWACGSLIDIHAEKEAEEARDRMLAELADQFETSVMAVVNTLSSSATQMQTTAQTMTATARESSDQSQTVASAAEQASANVHTVASAADELSSSIVEISRQVADAARVAGSASEEASRTNTMVQSLANAADKISDVVKLINAIASQTHLLALNATIEAARAGEAGKGFAVVAGEVKSLANQTGKATEEISGQIEAVQAETRRAVDAIRTIGNVIEQMRQISSSIAAAVEEQGASTREIARNVEEAAVKTQQVSANISGVTSSAASTGAAAGEVSASAGALAQNADKLRGEVNGFLAKVRAGRG